MKKQFILIAAMIMFSFAACSDKNVPNNPNNDTEQGDGKDDGDEDPQPQPEYYGKDAKVNTNYQAKPFTVGIEKQVLFSQGNLQYQASTNTWQFAEQQNERLGKAANLLISATNSHWIDHFGWGTSGYNSKYPYMTSRTNEDYGNGTADLVGTDYDWGQFNAIRNGGNEKGLWRLMTKDEWVYMFDTRENAANLRAFATVDTVKGYLLLPDGYAFPSGITFTPGTLDWNKNIYKLEQWQQMEALGAVFLPVTGLRAGDNHFSSFTTDGCYWNGTCPSHNLWGETQYSSISGGEFWFQKGRATPTAETSRLYGIAVRLVKDVVK